VALFSLARVLTGRSVLLTRSGAASLRETFEAFLDEIPAGETVYVDCAGLTGITLVAADECFGRVLASMLGSTGRQRRIVIFMAPNEQVSAEFDRASSERAVLALAVRGSRVELVGNASKDERASFQIVAQAPITAAALARRLQIPHQVAVERLEFLRRNGVVIRARSPGAAGASDDQYVYSVPSRPL
jgi:hypothetical protein